jgi:non-ribosomal peptide synthetase component F
MMEDGAACALITVADLAPAFMRRLEDDLCIIELDDDVMGDLEAPEVGECPVTSASDLAYCIFTSGSTGRPKGVPIYHAALMNLLESFRVEVRAPPACILSASH